MPNADSLTFWVSVPARDICVSHQAGYRTEYARLGGKLHGVVATCSIYNTEDTVFVEVFTRAIPEGYIGDDAGDV